MNIRKLEAVFELPPITPVDGDDIRFRLEIFSLQGRYVVEARVWELMRLTPSFPLNGVAQADLEILVGDDALALSDIATDSVDEALSQAISIIRRQLGLASDWPG